MITEVEATIIVKEYLSNNERIFRIPKYRILKRVLYWFILLYKKIRYRKIFLNDYEHIGYILPSKRYKNRKEVLSILEIEVFEEVFVFYLGTNMSFVDPYRYFGMRKTIEKPIIIDRTNSNLYRLLHTGLGVNIYIDIFKNRAQNQELFYSSFAKLT
ncbi:hypothetical protein [Aureispira anguillae]|uniref:Uncharacterized protein n=1 Tax=Aureispira anguillae TaxID=2864201 RepID=A0A915YMF3_9BACT|nr:hypothetical protein [Aureispira anguillae]BDS15661.1 hypothetical protein AsAng_0064450 [Aureispira anguillae]